MTIVSLRILLITDHGMCVCVCVCVCVCMCVCVCVCVCVFRPLNFKLQISQGGGLRLAPITAASSHMTSSAVAGKTSKSDGQLFFVKNTASGEPQLFMAFSSQPSKLYLLQPSAGHQLNVKVNTPVKSAAGVVSPSGPIIEVPRPGRIMGQTPSTSKQIVVLKSPFSAAAGTTPASTCQDLGTQSLLRTMVEGQAADLSTVGGTMEHKMGFSDEKSILGKRKSTSLWAGRLLDDAPSASPSEPPDVDLSSETKHIRHPTNFASILRHGKRASAKDIALKKKPKAASLLTSALWKCSQSVETEADYSCSEQRTSFEATENARETEDAQSEESPFPFKIDSVFSLAATNEQPSDFLTEEEESGVYEQKAIKVEDFNKTYSYTQEELVDMCGSSFVVLERLGKRDIDTKGDVEDRSRCSDYCRKRTLNYLCMLGLIRCHPTKQKRIKLEESESSFSEANISKQEASSSTDSVDNQASTIDVSAEAQHETQVLQVKRELPEYSCRVDVPTDSACRQQQIVRPRPSDYHTSKSASVESILASSSQLPAGSAQSVRPDGILSLKSASVESNLASSSQSPAGSAQSVRPDGILSLKSATVERNRASSSQSPAGSAQSVRSDGILSLKSIYPDVTPTVPPSLVVSRKQPLLSVTRTTSNQPSCRSQHSPANGSFLKTKIAPRLETSVKQGARAAGMGCPYTDSVCTSEENGGNLQRDIVSEKQNEGLQMESTSLKKDSVSAGSFPTEKDSVTKHLDTQTTDTQAEAPSQKDSQETESCNTVEVQQEATNSPHCSQITTGVEQTHSSQFSSSASKIYTAGSSFVAKVSADPSSIFVVTGTPAPATTTTPRTGTFVVSNSMVIKPSLPAATCCQTALPASLVTVTASRESKAVETRVTTGATNKTGLVSSMAQKVATVKSTMSSTGGAALTVVPGLQPVTGGPYFVVMSNTSSVATSISTVTAAAATSNVVTMCSHSTGTQSSPICAIPVQTSSQIAGKPMLGQRITVASKSSPSRMSTSVSAECPVVTLSSVVVSKAIHQTVSSAVAPTSSATLKIVQSSSTVKKISKDTLAAHSDGSKNLSAPVTLAKGTENVALKILRETLTAPLTLAKGTEDVAVKILREPRYVTVSKSGTAPASRTEKVPVVVSATCSQKAPSTDAKEPRSYVRLMKVPSGTVGKLVPVSAPLTSSAPMSSFLAPVKGQVVPQVAPPTSRVVLVPVPALSATSVRQSTPRTASVPRAATGLVTLGHLGSLVNMNKSSYSLPSASPNLVAVSGFGKSLVVPSRFQTPASSTLSSSSKSLSSVCAATTQSTASSSPWSSPQKTSDKAASPVTVIIKPPSSGLPSAYTNPTSVVVPRSAADSVASDSKQPFLKIIMPTSGSSVFGIPVTKTSSTSSVTAKTVAADSVKSLSTGSFRLTPRSSNQNSVIASSHKFEVASPQTRLAADVLSASQSVPATSVQTRTTRQVLRTLLSSNMSTTSLSVTTSTTPRVTTVDTVESDSVSKLAKTSMDESQGSSQNKRARLEKRYPLPPGVVIKTEPETSGYPPDANLAEIVEHLACSCDQEQGTSVVFGTEAPASSASQLPCDEKGSNNSVLRVTDNSCVGAPTANEPGRANSRQDSENVDLPVEFQFADPTNDSDEAEPPADLECPDLEVSVYERHISHFDAPPVLTRVSPLPVRHQVPSSQPGQDRTDVYNTTFISTVTSSSHSQQKYSTSSKGNSHTSALRSKRSKPTTRDASLKTSQKSQEEIPSEPAFSDARGDRASGDAHEVTPLMRPTPGSSSSLGASAPSTSFESQTSSSFSSNDRIRQLKEMLKQQNEELERIRRQRASQPPVSFDIDG